jgi:hypothetical protein
MSFPGARSILSAAVAHVLKSNQKESLLSKLVERDLFSPKNSISTFSGTKYMY